MFSNCYHSQFMNITNKIRSFFEICLPKAKMCRKMPTEFVQTAQGWKNWICQSFQLWKFTGRSGDTALETRKFERRGLVSWAWKLLWIYRQRFLRYGRHRKLLPWLPATRTWECFKTKPWEGLCFLDQPTQYNMKKERSYDEKKRTRKRRPCHPVGTNHDRLRRG